MASLGRQQCVGSRLVEQKPPRHVETVVVPHDVKSVQNVMTEAASVADGLNGMVGLKTDQRLINKGRRVLDWRLLYGPSNVSQVQTLKPSRFEKDALR